MDTKKIQLWETPTSSTYWVMEIPGDQLKAILRKTFCRIPPATVMIFYKIMSNDIDFFYTPFTQDKGVQPL